jgi:hypothetical protein
MGADPWQLRAAGFRGRHVDATRPNGMPSCLRRRRPGLDPGFHLPVVGWRRLRRT